MKAINSLYLEVESSIADAIKEKVVDALLEADTSFLQIEDYIPSVYSLEKAKKVSNDIVKEVYRAKNIFPSNFVNQHEAYAVILEEIDELWEEIKKNQKNYDLDAQRKEATQAAAMLVRLLIELL